MAKNVVVVVAVVERIYRARVCNNLIPRKQEVENNHENKKLSDEQSHHGAL